MRRTMALVNLALSSLVLASPTAWAQETCVGVQSSPITGSSMAYPTATADQPAVIKPAVSGTATKPTALKLTLCPIAVDPDIPFLARVYATPKDGSNSGEALLLGSVSFYGIKTGKPQEFVVAAPAHKLAEVKPDGDVTIDIVPANTARVLTNTSIQVLKAQF